MSNSDLRWKNTENKEKETRAEGMKDNVARLTFASRSCM